MPSSKREFKDLFAFSNLLIRISLSPVLFLGGRLSQPSPFQKSLPMYATYSRMVGTPIIILLLKSSWHFSELMATALFVLLSATDWLDGYWARKYQAESPMGKFMDPIADKVLVLGALVMLLDIDLVDPFMVFLLIARDIFIGGIRSVAAANHVIIAAKPFGKWKTAIQMTAIPLLFLSKSDHNSLQGLPLWDIGYWGLWISVILSLLSGIQYSFGYYKNR